MLVLKPSSMAIFCMVLFLASPFVMNGQDYLSLSHIEGLVLRKNSNNRVYKKIDPERLLTFRFSTVIGGTTTLKSIVGFVKSFEGSDSIEILPTAVISEIYEDEKLLSKNEKYAEEGGALPVTNLNITEYEEVSVLYSSKSRYVLNRVGRTIRLSTGIVGLATIPFLASEKSRSNATSYVNPNVTKGLLIGFVVGAIIGKIPSEKVFVLKHSQGFSPLYFSIQE